MSSPWIPDEKGKKMIIPKELYSEIRKIIRKHQDDSMIRYHTVSQRDINEFFENKFLPKDKRYK